MRRATLVVVLFAFSVFAQKPPASNFDYDAKQLLDTQDVAVNFRGPVGIYDLSYANGKGGRAYASLVLPPGKGPHAAIIWGHWCWANSDLHNHKEFLDEAVALAPSGVVSLLLDFPIARPGYQSDPDPLSSKPMEELAEQVLAIRRGADLLLGRPFVDPKRLAYVGHSCGATAGEVVSGVDKRFRAFVLMAAGLSYPVIQTTAEFRDFREKNGPEKVDAFVARNSWADPGRYVSHAAPATVLLQYATQENFLTPERGRAMAAVVSEPKQFKVYDAPHALNAEARRDRITFLAEQLHFQPPSTEAIAALKDLPQPPEPKP